MGIRAVERTDVGVPAWWVDGEDEPCEAWLVFRVGIADETLLTRGITRLALELGRTGVRHHDVDLEVVVEAAWSGYHLTGDPDDVAGAIGDLARSLVMPPMERLDDARHQVIIRSAHTALPPNGFASAMHFGAAGYGLRGFDDFGVGGANVDTVGAWMRRFLSGRNAAQAWSCRPPDRWSIALPFGGRVPTPACTPSPLPTPRCSVVGELGPWAGVAVRAGAGLAGPVAARMVVRRLLERTGPMPVLRRTGQTPRLVSADHSALDGRSEVWLLECDGRPSEQPSARMLFDLAWELADEGTDPHEIRTIASDVRAELLDRGQVARRALHAAVTELLDSREAPDHRHPDLVRDLHPEAVRQAWVDALATAIWIVPLGEAPPFGSGPRNDQLTPMPRKGQRFTSIDGRRTPELVVGEHVVALVDAPDSGTVVPFGQCAALVDLDDGTSFVIGANGETVVVDPAAWVGGPDASRALHDRIPQELQVRSPVPVGGLRGF